MPESCSGQAQMSFVSEQMRPCFVPFLSRPPGWGCGGTLSPKLPCLTSAMAAQGTSLLGCRAAARAIRALLLCKCQDSLAAVAAVALRVCSTEYICVCVCVRVCMYVCVSLHVCVCVCVFTSLSAFHDCRRWHTHDWKLWHQRWGCKAAGCEEALELLQLSQQAPAALLPICLTASCCLCCELPSTPHLLRKLEKWVEWSQIPQSRPKYWNLNP